MRNKKIKNKNRRPACRQAGQVIMITTIFFLMISIAVISGVVVPVTNQISTVANYQRARTGFLAADAVNEEAFYRLNLGRTLPASITLPFTGNISAIAQVTDVGNAKQIVTTGENGSTVRYAKSIFSLGSGSSFNYGLQVGTGGVDLSGGSYITGSVYSAGPIEGDSGTYITGSATVSDTSSPVVSQSNGSSEYPNPIAVVFGNLSTKEDLAESFKLNDSGIITSLQVYLKKVGNPSNITVKIVNDSSNKPGSTVYGSGTISSNIVTSSYSYVDVPISSITTFDTSTKYWIVLDTSTSASNYYTAATTDGTYASGKSKIGGGSSWSDVNPSDADLIFRLYVGGTAGTISGQGQSQRLRIGTGSTGSAWANLVDSISVGASLYCQVGEYNYYISGGAAVACDSSRGNPPAIPFPISDANILEWKDTADESVYTGNYSINAGTTTSIGPKKIIGNLSVSGGATLNLTGPVWVTGNISLSGDGVIRLDSAYGQADGLIITDGTVTANGGGHFDGSGTSESYIAVVTTSTSNNAVSLNGGSGSVVLYAPNGTVTASGGASAKSIVAKRITLTGGANISYDTGLADINFANGPSGAWTVDSWGEVAE